MQGIKTYKETPEAVLLDVRTVEEYQSGHIPESENIPLSNIETSNYAKETPLFVYCYSGARSDQACRILKKQGYQNIVNIGGIANYQGPIEK